MSDNEARLIDVALAENLISAKQAQLIRNELRMFPNQKAGASLVRHQYLSEEELAGVRARAAAGKSATRGISTPTPSNQSIARPVPIGSSSAASAVPVDESDEASEGAGRADDSTISSKAEKPATGKGRNWSPLNAAVNAATRRAQRTSRSAAPSPDIPDDADTRTEMMDMLRRRGMGRRAAELPPTAPESEPVPIVPVPPPQPKRKDRSADLQRLKALLANARGDKASDVHLSPGRPPFTRASGLIHYPDLPSLTPEESEDLCMSCLSDDQEELIRKQLQLNFSFEFAGGGRYRCSVYRQRVGWQGAFRVIPDRIPTMKELNLSESLERLTEYHQGMILVTGPAGSGKTTTIAAMLQHINEARQDHIVTLEDPVEYVFESKKCQITQREVGVHTRSFAHGLRAALREDPDVVLVGDLGDIETISMAASAAETGHLVFGTLHTGSAVRTVVRMIDSYPAEQRPQVSSMISKSLRGVISQQLIPRTDGRGLALAQEILIFTSAVSALVREGKTHLLPSAIQSGKKAGMKLMDESLLELAQNKIISRMEAVQRADNKQAFEGLKDW